MISKRLAEFPMYEIFEDGSVIGPSGKVLKPQTTNGYNRLRFRSDTEERTLQIHRVVAHLFHNMDLYDLTFEPDHLDNDKLNNHKDNIEVVTKSENCRRRSGRAPNSNIDTKTEKQCSKSMMLKPRIGFQQSKRSADGQGSWCRECTLEYKRAYGRAHRLKHV